VTVALAGTLHTLHQPIVSPNVASSAFTIGAFLVVLIGGIGTLSCAVVGAAVYRLIEFFFDEWFGETVSFLLGVIYIVLVLFVSYRIVGTWKLRRLSWTQGWRSILGMVGLREGESET